VRLLDTLTVRTASLLAGGLVVLGGLAGVVAWPALPAEMAIHFGPAGPDRFVPKLQGVLLVPALGLATILFVWITERTPADPLVTALGVLFLGVTLTYVHGLVLLWNLGVSVDVTAAVAPILVGAAALVYLQYRGLPRFVRG